MGRGDPAFDPPGQTVDHKEIRGEVSSTRKHFVAASVYATQIGPYREEGLETRLHPEDGLIQGLYAKSNPQTEHEPGWVTVDATAANTVEKTTRHHAAADSIHQGQSDMIHETTLARLKGNDVMGTTRPPPSLRDATGSAIKLPKPEPTTEQPRTPDDRPPNGRRRVACWERFTVCIHAPKINRQQS